MSEKLQAKKLKGFRDYQSSSARDRKWINDTVIKQAQLAGFELIDTPTLELATTLLGSGGEEVDKEVYRFKDHGDRDVAMRFDLTVPFARFVAENRGTLAMPFKKVQVGNVWRGEKPQKGRYREFCQGDIDIVGVDSLYADVDVMAVVASVLDQIVPAPATIKMGNRILLSALIGHFVPTATPKKETAILIVLDKLEKISSDKICSLLTEIEGISASTASELVDAVKRKNTSGASDFESLRSLMGTHEVFQKELQRFQDTVELIKESCGKSSLNFLADLSIARGLGYYTGIVFETTVDSLPSFGSISSGGRYNQLVSRFSNEEVPGVGGSVGVDRVLAVRQELKQQEDLLRQGVYIVTSGIPGRQQGYKMAKLLRESGFPVSICLNDRKLGQHFKYADRKSFRFVAILGDDELASNTVTLKDLSTGGQKSQIGWTKMLEAFESFDS